LAQHAVDILHHIAVREAEHTQALAFDEPCPRRIVTFAIGVHVAIDLDDESFGEAQDIDVERADRRLMAPFVFRKGLTQRTQQPTLGFGRVAA